MKKISWSLLLLVLYTIPYSYIGMLTDYYSLVSDYRFLSLVGYALAFIGTGYLAIACVKKVSWIVCLLGNVLSFLVSKHFIHTMEGQQHWEGYFKPFSPSQLMTGFAIALLVVQLFVMWLSKRKKEKHV